MNPINTKLNANRYFISINLKQTKPKRKEVIHINIEDLKKSHSGQLSTIDITNFRLWNYIPRVGDLLFLNPSDKFIPCPDDLVPMFKVVKVYVKKKLFGKDKVELVDIVRL